MSLTWVKTTEIVIWCARKEFLSQGKISGVLVFESIHSILILISFEPRHEISNNMVCATSKGFDQPAHERSLIRAFATRLNILCVFSY